MKTSRLWVFAVTLVGSGILYCAGAQQTSEAIARLKDPKGNDVGVVRFSEGDKGVVIRAEIRGLAPGEHAFHIHEKAACERPDFKSAGGHFNPTGTQHGFLNIEGPHAGDLPNITVEQDSMATMEVVTNRVTLKENADNSLFRSQGTAIVMHRNPDDYFTDPAGAGGDRIACGEIERIKQ